MKKILLILFFIFCVINLNAQTATAPILGDGSSGNPYQITSLENLYWIYVDNTRWSLHYIQTSDIDASNTSTWYSGGAVIGNTGWYPIGTHAPNNFNGSYNGQNYNINDIYSARSEYGGLFGHISSSAQLLNVNIVNINVDSDAYYGAGLVGTNNGGTISNCSSSGTISGLRQSAGLVGENIGGTITNSFSTATVITKADGGTSQAGGFVHSNSSSGIIDNCYSTGTVTGWQAGGFAYNNDYLSTIKNCYSSSNMNGWGYAGGFIGRNANILDACYASGDVAGGGEYVGGFIGECSGSSIITNCYSLGNITRSSGSTAWEYGAFAGRKNGSISYSYSTGSVYYTDATDPTEKGFVGRHLGGTYSNNFWDSAASNQDYDNPDHDAGTPIIAAIAKTTTEMKNYDTFTLLATVGLTIPWDFVSNPNNDTGNNDLWDLDCSDAINSGYPFLSWQGSTILAPEIKLMQGQSEITDGGIYNFGSKLVGSDTDIILNIVNIGCMDLTFTTPFAIGGTDENQFSIQIQPTSPCEREGGQSSFTIRFSPTSVGAKTAIITIANNDSDENPFDLILNGEGVVPEMDLKQDATAIADGGNFNYGDQSLGTNTNIIFTIENTGTAELTLTTALSISGTNANQFSIEAEPSSPVAVSGGSTTFTVGFSPTSIGVKSATIAIANNDSDENPYDLTLNGTGTTPEINLKQDVTEIADGGSYDYGKRSLSTDTDIIFTIENTGTEELTLAIPLTIGGAEADQFSIQTQPTSPVSVSGSTAFTVRYSPTSNGYKNATIAITNNDIDENPYNLLLKGFGGDCISGSVIYNTATNKFNFCEDGTWVEK